MKYKQFLERKIPVSQPTGFEVSKEEVHPMLWRHQPDIVKWALHGGRRAVFASFGMGKTMIQLAIADLCVKFNNDKPFLIGLPLGVRYEFQIDADKLGLKIKFVANQSDVKKYYDEGYRIFITNYEKIRNAKFQVSYFIGVSFDEASVLRNLDTQTTDYVLEHFSKVKYRFVCTATPSPNEYTELLNYAHFLGIMDRGQALTRFFGRNSTKAGDLQLYEHKEKEFWLWVSSWAIFVTKPSDLGYSDEGYDLPKLNIHYHRVTVSDRAIEANRDGQTAMFRNTAASLVAAAREKRESIPSRIDKMKEIITDDIPHTHYLIWHHLEAERKAIEQALSDVKTVYGSQKEDEREDYLTGFGAGKYTYLATKPEIAGSGCNFQRHCHKAIYLGIDFKFNDFIQSLHRIHRFMQMYEVDIHIIYTDAEEHVLKTLEAKWERHKEMVKRMTDIVKQYGLNNINIKSDLKRSMGVERKEVKGKNYTCVHNDNVLETRQLANDSIDLTVTSIPFSDQYEYCESYHDMGHNNGDAEFFAQLDYLTPELLRVTKPGRIACIHVKDRIRYGYQNNAGMITLSDFSGKTIAHFEKHGWYLMGKITVTTDVVMENNQTYRLSYSEQCKDGTKMGVGLPEYVLIFRKAPTEQSNSYADIPVTKEKDKYTLGKWQLDAHAYWKSSGNRLLTANELKDMDLKRVSRTWREYDSKNIYNFSEHVRICDELKKGDRLPTKYMLLPPTSNHPMVWTDVNRMKTLNTNQRLKKREKHVCPLQFDIIDRCITRYSNEGDVVYDPFGGIMSTVYRAVMLGRKGYGVELNEQYYNDGVKYCWEAEYKQDVPTLFNEIK